MSSRGAAFLPLFFLACQTDPGDASVGADDTGPATTTPAPDPSDSDASASASAGPTGDPTGDPTTGDDPAQLNKPRFQGRERRTQAAPTPFSGRSRSPTPSR